MLQSNETRYNLVLLGALGSVAAETQGLVGHELVGAGVDGSSHGDAKDNTERDQLWGDPLQGAQTLRDGVGAMVLLRSRERERPRGLHPQDTSGIHG